MMFGIQPFGYLKSVSTSPLSETFFSLVPVRRAFVADAATLCLATAVVLSVCIAVYELRKENTSLQKLLYYAVMLAHPTVLYFLKFELGFFYMITYFWSHWFIAIGLVGRVNTNFHRGRGLSASRSLLRHVLAIGAFALTMLVFSHHDRHLEIPLAPRSEHPQDRRTADLSSGIAISRSLRRYPSRSLLRVAAPITSITASGSVSL